MSRKNFTEEQQQLLRQNPYVFSISTSRLYLTKEFKEIFLAAYNSGALPRAILAAHGFDPEMLGERRIWSISYHIRMEYQQYGEFHEGYGPRNIRNSGGSSPDQARTEKEEVIQQLWHEVEYLKQEMEFLKKISSIRTTRK